MIKKLLQIIYFVLFLCYIELIFHIATFSHITTDFIYVIMFSFTYGGFMYILSNLFKSKINHVITYIFISFNTVLFIAQLVYNKIYSSIISIYSIGGGTGQVLQFSNQIIDVLKSNILYVILLFIPLIIYIVLDIKKVFDYKRVEIKKTLILCLSVTCIYVASLLSIELTVNGGMYSIKHLYYDVHAPLLTAQKLGILTEMRLDIKRSIIGFNEKDIVVEDKDVLNDKEDKKEEVIEYGYNVLDIDFDKLINEESNEVLKNMNIYFSNSTPSRKNEYTGMFKGKNLVVFVAEAFSELAIDKDLTPTLYKLYNEGFQFDNFYTPLFPVSTADGEYITDTSLIPKEGVWSLAKIKGNYMPFSYANVFENLGYTSNAYHDNTATYYNRRDFINTMGYDSFKACRAGLNINCKQWPESDLEMINVTTEDYINNEKFLAYYMTVSGHLEYTRNGNMMVVKNWDNVKDLNYSERAKSYISCQIELDRAVKLLIERLNEAGKLDDTVIMISADHYPYGLNLDEINELSKFEREEQFSIHKMPFLLWNSEMEKPIKVEKYAESLDVLPTILNLFAIDYDSRLLMGRDILSDSEGLVIFSDRSFITSKGKYNSKTRKFTSFDGSEVDKEYIEGVSSIIFNKYKNSKLILEKDYYRYLYNKLGWEIKN